MDEFRERMAALEAFAPTVGLEYSAEDTVGLDDAPFRLIQSGHRHLIGNVMWGWWRVCEAIAFDLGYGSLGPFNRAFRAATEVTPTEWRRQALACSKDRWQLGQSFEVSTRREFFTSRRTVSLTKMSPIARDW